METKKEAIQKTEFNVQLPVIPTVFFIEDKKTKEYKEYSVKVVEELETEVDEAIKAVKGFTDKKSYEVLEELKNRAVKLRTQPEAKRKELQTPINDFLKELKAKTDSIGDAAQLVQEKIEKKLNEKAEWEAEQERIENEKKAAKAKERAELIMKMGAQFNPLTNVYFFPYTEALVYNHEQLLEMDQDEWEDETVEVKKAWLAHKEKVEAEEAEEKARRAKLEEENKAMIENRLTMRRMMLDMVGAVYEEPYFTVNGHNIDPVDVKELSDEEWIKLMQEIKTPYMADTALVNEENPSEVAMVENEKQSSSDPLDAVIQGMVSKHDEQTVQTVVTSEQHGTRGVDVDLGEYMANIHFTDQHPFLEFTPTKANKSRIRIFPAGFEDEATANIHPDDYLGSGKVDWVDLMFVAFKNR